MLTNRKTMGLLARLFARPENETSVTEDAKDGLYPSLENLIGERIEVHYINADVSKVRTERLIHTGTDFFYVGKSTTSKYVIHWDFHDMDGRKHAVKLLRDSQGNTLYENKDLVFDYQHAYEKQKTDNI